MMPLTTVIFDMDGVLIDSEPFWEEAGKETLAQFGIVLTADQYMSTTGLRTREWIDWWFGHFGIGKQFSEQAEADILSNSLQKIKEHAIAMKGVDYIFRFFTERNFTVGLATSSPVALIEVVIEKLNLGNYIKAFSSAEELPYGKPHPEVYLTCAEKLNVSPLECICFEDSFNGVIAARAARMKCVVIPAKSQQQLPSWYAANIKLGSFLEFNEEVLRSLQ